MKKRILSFLLALLMVVSIFPAPAFATDSTDVTITPTETPTEAATEASCPTCGTVGCTSEHLNWCSDCQKDDCGQNHCDTCGAIDCTTEHKICDKCGTLDCTADHTNWCADCKVDNCGQNHCPTCRAIDCTKEHKACETCSVIDCTADHTNWCNICKFDNCGKDHNATEPTEPATEPVAPIDEGGEEETHPMMGKYVKLTASTMFGYVAEPNWSYVIVGSYPAFMEVSEVLEKDGVTYYRLKAAPNYSWPTAGGYSDDTVYLEATKLVVVTWCTECKEYDCGEDHTQSENPCDCGCENCTGTEGCTCRCGNCDFCERSNTCEICGEMDCDTVHFWCDRCEDYDCGKSHLICPACGEVDCTETHTWCPCCAGYDCGMEHEDEYKPDIAPVIPSNPEILAGEDVTVVDEYGEAISALSLEEGRKTSISAWPDGSADSYQWQVCINNGDMLWVDIYGATSKGLLVSPAMFLNIIDYYGETYVRCVAKVDGESKTSDPIPVTVEEAVPHERVMYATRPANDSVQTTAEDGGAIPTDLEVRYTITVSFVYDDTGKEAAQSWVASLSAGQSYVLDIPYPQVAGYVPKGATGDRLTESIVNISEDKIIVVNYVPDYMDFKVEHYWQNVYDDDFTLHESEIISGLKTNDIVGSNLQKDYSGFGNLPYDPEIAIAADGSTVVKIYYDREYYIVELMMNGGYGVESFVARYGTSIDWDDYVPQRTGYAFNGWAPQTGGITSLPATVPAQNTKYLAQWVGANTGFTVAFYYENANDTDYTFVGSVQQTAVTGSKVNGETYKDVAFEGRDNTHFTYEKADTNVEIAADGSSVVNVYFSRNTYLLEYYYYQCHHTHTNACCNLQHIHSTACCTKDQHTHSKSCVNNTLYEVGSSNAKKLKEKYGTVPNGFEGTLGNGTDFVYFDGTWYRCWTNTVDQEWNCGGDKKKKEAHTHGDGNCNIGCGKTAHDHSSGILASCNTVCSHVSGGWNCGCSNDLSNTSRWYAAYSGYHKYEEYVGDIHMQYGTSAGYRLIDVYRDGVATGETPTGGGAVGTFASMYGGYTAFYRSSDGGRPFYMTYWLESADGNGTRVFDGKTFVKSTTFFTMMSFVSFENDYQIGTPHGFNSYKATFGDADNSGSATDTFTNYLSTSQDSQSPYNNFYYTRKTYTLTYFNGSTQVATRTMKFEEPLTSTYNLQNLAMTSPYGSGYYFAGWCLDADCTIPVSWGSTKMPEGGMAVYAKWAPVAHTVTYSYETAGGTVTATVDITHGSVAANAPADPTREGYSFAGWFYVDPADGKEKAYSFALPVYKDMDLYAKWTSDTLIYGVISYKDANGNPVAGDTPIRGSLNATITYEAKTGDELDPGFQSGYFPRTLTHSITFTDRNTAQNNYTFIYDQMEAVSYTISFVDKTTGQAVLDKKTGQPLEPVTGTTRESHINYKLQDEGKMLSGYTVDAMEKTFTLSSTESLNNFVFYYTPDEEHATVQVIHYIQNINGGDNYGHYLTEPTTKGKIGDTITANILDPEGFTYNASKSTASAELTADGLVLSLYYDRDRYSYEFRFLVKGTDTALADPIGGTDYYGKTIPQVAPSFDGYKLTTAGSMSITIGVTESDNVRTFYYEENTATIRYSIGAMGTGGLSINSEEVKAWSGAPQGATASETNPDYTFTGWYRDYRCTDLITKDETFVPTRSENTAWTNVTYYAGFQEASVIINYEVSPAGAGSLSRSAESLPVLTGYQEGTTITPARGYHFVKWVDADGNTVSTTANFRPSKPGERWVEATYTAVMEEDLVTVNYKVVGYGTASNTSDQVAIFSGETSSTVTWDSKVENFIGWYDAEGNLLHTQPHFTPTRPESGWIDGTTYYAKFESIPYTITFVDRDKPVKTDTYTYGNSLTIPEVANGNYVAATWTVKEDAGEWKAGTVLREGDLLSYCGNVTLVANWIIDAIWIDWDFNIFAFDEDDILYSQPDVPYGTDPVYAGDLTTDALAVRQNTAQYTYTFKKWVEEDLSSYETLPGDEIKGIVVYRADYEKTVNKYTVTWQNEDGTTIDTTEVEYGTIPTHAAPTKEETAEFTYTFAGWTPEVVAVTENATYKATFTEAKKSYTITWLNDDDSVIDTTSVAYGEVPTHADPNKAATAEYTYTFAGWSPEVAAVIGEATYKATYTAEKNKYTITWKNEDGTILETDAGVEYGTMPSYDGETPTKEPYNQYTYTFRAWSPEIVTVTGDAVYIASFDPHENFYTVTWVNHDGEVLETDKNVAWDTMPEYNGDTPEKTGNAEHSYTFAGWSPTVSKVNGHATYTATFAESVNTYTVTWKNEDGTVLETDEDMVYGAMPSYDGETPEKAATAQYTYTFDDWDKEVVAVTGDVTYTAKFSATVNKYTVTFVDEDGTTILKEATEYEYGTKAVDIKKPDDPSKAATAEYTYTFAGWTPEIADVTANVTYKATYTEVKNQYTLSGEIDHGTVTDSVTVNYGTQAKITFTPAVGYKFQSYTVNNESATSITTSEETWSYEEQQLTENKRVVVTTAPIEYTIAYELDGGSLPEGVTNPGIYTVETETFTLNNPTKTGYKFVGWATSENANTGKETVTIEQGTTGDKTFYAVWERSLVDLTITTTSADQEQSYIFTVSGTPSDPSYGTITLDVVLVGSDSITIKDLPVGEYTVTEKDGWSWRENEVESKTADLRTTSQTVSFDFGVVDDLHWLSGYSYNKRKKGGS